MEAPGNRRGNLRGCPSRAIRFGRELEKAVASLSWSPQRCPVVREHPDYRQLIVKKYRVIFHIARREAIIDAIVYPYQLFDPAQA